MTEEELKIDCPVCDWFISEETRQLIYREIFPGNLAICIKRIYCPNCGYEMSFRISDMEFERLEAKLKAGGKQ